ncbi:uncharacterized protein KY384_003751 [Bacidia gigantensis]|uniref:uncharacterized protein n=1 Tax=Bacidia gigantensis TaxID=2732470 RepID=UPI001D04B17C|nr:uncharacterized protein KY384_003751 [Bacidia gigantensis]KAG8532114.1 hypothetical protein KY384_003751 [Bacidia gigantensis]
MSIESTLDFESLSLETPTPTPRTYIPPHKRRGRKTGSFVQHDDQAKPPYHHEASEDRPWSSIPSYTALDVPPLGSSTALIRSGREINPQTQSIQSFPPKRSTLWQRDVVIPSIEPTSHVTNPNSRWAQLSRSEAQKRQMATSARVKKGSSNTVDSVRRSNRLKDTQTIEKPSKPHLARSLSTPIPTADYLSRVTKPPRHLLNPQPLLLILDLNGTLIARNRMTQYYRPRLHLPAFLSHCLSNYKILIWSSATPRNVQSLCSQLFAPDQLTQLVGIWGRDTLGLSKADYVEKVQVYKRLGTVWADEDVQRSCPGYTEGKRWGPWNTILVDDSMEKARGEPWNLVQVPELELVKVLGKDERSEKAGKRGKAGKKGQEKKREETGVEILEVDVLAQVVGWLEEARMWSDVSAFSAAMGKRFAVGAGWIWNWGEEVSNVDNRVPSVEESDEEWKGFRDVEGGVKLPIRQ